MNLSQKKFLDSQLESLEKSTDKTVLTEKMGIKIFGSNSEYKSHNRLEFLQPVMTETGVIIITNNYYGIVICKNESVITDSFNVYYPEVPAMWLEPLIKEINKFGCKIDNSFYKGIITVGFVDRFAQTFDEDGTPLFEGGEAYVLLGEKKGKFLLQDNRAGTMESYLLREGFESPQEKKKVKVFESGIEISI